MAFGVDSASPATLTGLLGRAGYPVPAFWGRYLPDFPINAAQAASIRGAGACVLPIWNGDGDGTIISGKGPPGGGAEQAKRCADAWGTLGLPLWSRIYYDVETLWYLDGPTLLDFMQTLWTLKFSPGIYCNPASGFNHQGGYRWARGRCMNVRTGYWTSEWETSPAPVHVMPAITGFPNQAVITGYAAECDLWQTWENINDVDYDVAQTLIWMWQPRLLHAAHTMALKPSPPSHVTPSMRTLLGGDVLRALGPTQTDINPLNGTPETWLKVSVFDATGTEHTGWVPSQDTYRS